MSSGKFDGPVSMALTTIAGQFAKAATGATISATLSPFGGPQIKIGFEGDKPPIDERLAKIEAARANLQDALGAIEELAVEAEQNKRDLRRLQEAVDHASTERENVNAQLDVLKSLQTLDSEAMRRALKLPTATDIWRDRIFAFVAGVIASIVATLAWEWLIKPMFPG